MTMIKVPIRVKETGFSCRESPADLEIKLKEGNSYGKRRTQIVRTVKMDKVRRFGRRPLLLKTLMVRIDSNVLGHSKFKRGNEKDIFHF